MITNTIWDRLSDEQKVLVITKFKLDNEKVREFLKKPNIKRYIEDNFINKTIVITK